MSTTFRYDITRHGPLLTPEETAKRIGAKASTLATWRCNRKGPPYLKLNNRVRYPQELVDEWLVEDLELVMPGK